MGKVTLPDIQPQHPIFMKPYKHERDCSKCELQNFEEESVPVPVAKTKSMISCTALTSKPSFFDMKKLFMM